MHKQPYTPGATPVHYISWEAMPGGSESSVTQYVNWFTGRRMRYIFSLRPSGNGLTEDPTVGFEQGAYENWRCYLKYFRYCRRHRSHLFHLVSTGPVILLLTLLAGVKNPVYHIHGTIYWKSAPGRLYLKTCWWLTSFFRVKFVANSEHSASIFQKNIYPAPLQIVYNGFDIQQFVEKRHLRTQLRRIAYIGRLAPGKNVETVVRLFQDIASEMPELELHLAGNGPCRTALETQAAGGPGSERIVFHGYQKDVAAFYASVDLFVFLSDYESFGNVLAEALLTGLPILTSGIPVFNEIHGGEPAFLLGDPQAYEALLANFRRALSHFPELARKAFALGENLQAKFDLTKHLTAIESIYEQIESTGNLLPLGSASAL